MFAYTTPYNATGYTLFELTYGRQAELPTALTKPLKPTYNYDDYVQELKERLRATQLARERLKEEKAKAKQQYDKRAGEIKFKISDKLLVYNQTLYTVKKRRKTSRMHVNRIKSFIEA